VKGAFRPVPNARFHRIPPLGSRFDYRYIHTLFSHLSFLSRSHQPLSNVRHLREDCNVLQD
jgi:hypothetical protein